MSYTCISCRVAFSDGEVQRAHYKTDWHRYNLKRKVAEMPPVTAENFQERVLAQRAAADRQLSAAAAGEFCATCSKKFNTANAYHNHLQSHKHQQVEKQAVLAAQRKVEKMNEKNLEKGLSGGEEEQQEEEEGRTDHDAKNQALRDALKEQQHRASPGKTQASSSASTAGPQETQASSSASTGLQEEKGGGAEERRRAEKAPRMVWLEEQARRMETKDKEEQGDAAVAAMADEEEWEDVVDDDDDDDDDDMEEDEEQGESMEQQEEGSAASGDRPDDVLPGSLVVTDCLFCSHHSRTLVKNVAHMTKVHSFFIPDVEFLVDLRGMIRYLAEKVGAGNVCLWCNEKGRSFYSTKAVQGHMVDKSHCKLFTDGDAALEFADFYDFRSTYPDRKEGEDVDMEDEGLPDEKNLEYDEDTDFLTLPSGARIGHRSLMRYYKQRFGVQRTVAVRTNRNAVGRVLKQYRALGWAGDMGSSSVYRVQKDMQYVQRMKSRWMMRMGMNHNKTKQHHFRAQVCF